MAGLMCRLSVVLIVLLFAVAPGPVRAEILAGTELVRVDDESLTFLDLLRLAQQNREIKPHRVTDSRVIASLVDDLIFSAVARQEALKTDLSQDWHHQNRLRKALTAVATQLYYDEVMLPSIVIDSAKIDSFYQANIERYTVPEKQRYVSQITVYKEGWGIPSGYTAPLDTLYKGWDPKRKIDSIYIRLMEGQEFSAMAILYSEEPRARTTAGVWGWTSKDAIADTSISRLVFEQPLHRISRPIELAYGWTIVHVSGERQAGATPLDDIVGEDIRANLTLLIGRAQAERLMDSLTSAAHFETVDPTLAVPDSALAPGEPMLVVNGSDTIRASDYLLFKTQQGALRGFRNLSPEQRRDALMTIARSVTLLQMLRDLGYMERRELRDVMRREQIQGGVDLILNTLDRHNEPTEEELRAYYNDHIREFTPEQRHFIEYRIFDDTDSATALAQAWRDGRAPDWADSRWVGPDDVPNAIWNRIAGVPPGTVVGPLVVDGQHWVVSLTRIAQPKTLGEMRGTIIPRVSDEKTRASRQRWLRSVIGRHTIVRHHDRIAVLELPTITEATAILSSIPDTNSIKDASIIEE